MAATTTTVITGGFILTRLIRSITLGSQDNAAARAAVNLGVWASIMSCLGPLALALSVPGIIVGHVALVGARRRGGRPVAVFGLAVSYLAALAHLAILGMMVHRDFFMPAAA